MDDFTKGWNAAIKAARETLLATPTFPNKDYGPEVDALIIRVMEACRRQVGLLKDKPQRS